jgi:hypothetical protein
MSRQGRARQCTARKAGRAREVSAGKAKHCVEGRKGRQLKWKPGEDSRYGEAWSDDAR